MSHFIQINPECFMINYIKIYSCYFQALVNCCTLFFLMTVWCVHFYLRALG